MDAAEKSIANLEKDLGIEKNQSPRLFKQKLSPKRLAVVILSIMIAATIRAITVHCFISPNNFAPGGATGVSILLQYLTKLNAAYYIVLLNIPLFILAFIYIGKLFSLITAITTFLTSGIILLFERFGVQTFTPSNTLLPAIASGILTGASLAIILKAGGSTGGTDIVAILINKKFSATNVAWFIFACDATVVATSFLVFQNFEVVLIALCEMFVASKTVETITQGFKNALKYEIITSRPQEISQAIFEQVGRGVTCIPAKGMFTGAEKTLLICIVRKRQVPAFNRLLREFASDSFTYITRTSEVIGLGFKST